jgi:hypothetical protein
MAEATKVPVTPRALIQRINRGFEAAAKEKGDPAWLALRIHKSRGRQIESIGAYYLLDKSANTVRDCDVSLETMARELGVLDEHETVVE